MDPNSQRPGNGRPKRGYLVAGIVLLLIGVAFAVTAGSGPCNGPPGSSCGSVNSYGLFVGLIICFAGGILIWIHRAPAGN